ncbi:right-handed parallel beta-helix repeat-containing protein [Phytohabitans kaempferiae]|uniref:Right-handed parallel beta-helix repeat-containing protein n=1 Tax=Phytohabitans kaempferiae TaxID=1620943 RepID=A0ABV6M4F1_9ACTN
MAGSPSLSRRGFVGRASAAAALGVVGASAAGTDASASPARRPGDGRQFVDVTTVDGAVVRKPLVRSDRWDARVAAENSKRIRAILTSPSLGPRAVIYFPAGQYYFDGAAGDWDATIRTTHPMTTIQGDGMYATVLRQHSRTVEATVKVVHDECAIVDLGIASTDRSDRFEPAWSDRRHRSAIHIAAGDERWYMDPRVERVSVNSEGNNIVVANYYRPFENAIQVTGPWLNVYVHTAWLRDIKNGINVVQGARIAGPAKFIDVNCYATPPTDSKLWTRFFTSETHLMEQVELIHCTFIGSQFIYLNGDPAAPGGSYTPVYNMVIDHNYINCAWVGSPPGDYTYSGIYLRLPPAADGANHSRDIRFTNNSCTGGLPDRPAFFYVDGVVRGVTFADNDVSSGGMDKCVYIRGSQAFGDEEVAVRDVKIVDNYFRNYATPITVGGDAGDPSRPSGDDDRFFTDRVIVSGNQTQNEPAVERIGRTTCSLFRCRKASVTGNSFVDTALTAISVTESAGVVVANNTVAGLGDNGGYGVLVRRCEDATVVGNTATRFKFGIRAEGGNGVSVADNTVSGALAAGLSLAAVTDAGVTGNIVRGGAGGLTTEALTRATIVGNTFDEPQPAPAGTGLIVRANNGVADVP